MADLTGVLGLLLRLEFVDKYLVKLVRCDIKEVAEVSIKTRIRLRHDLNKVKVVALDSDGQGIPRFVVFLPQINPLHAIPSQKLG